MVVAVSDPVEINHILYVGTDHVWAMRRVSDDKPIIPQSAKAEIRSEQTDELWLECTISIDSTTGWIYIRIPVAQTVDPVWKSRKLGVWDIEVILDGYKYRWAYGNVEVSREVTLS